MNTEYPLLVFPKPTEPVDRSKMGGGGGKPHVPSAGDNAKRISPKFADVQKILDDRKMNIQQGAEGVNPEDVLVLETAGRVEDFYKAVSCVEGFEWLLEEDFEGTPDEDFYETNDKGKKIENALSSRLYLVSTDSKALNQIISMYNQYVKNPKITLPAGCYGFKAVFEQLRDVRFWNYKDRIDGSDFLERWLQNNEAFPEKPVRFQVELWFRGQEAKRRDAQNQVKMLVEAAEGRVISSCIIEDIRYHALLVEVPGGKMRQMIDDMEEGSLILSKDIMYFKAMPQTVVGEAEDEIEIEEECEPTQFENAPTPTGSSVVALFDGMPLQNHELLAGRLNIDDPENFADLAEYKKRIHGTEMASLIIHGDMSNPGEPIDTPLYVRPITLPYEKVELLPEDRLAVDLVHRAVKRLFDGEGGNPPVAPNVKIINLSIGDPVRTFHGSMSPMARLLDWLSFKYSVLFIISAGNNAEFSMPNDPILEVIRNKDQNAISKYVTAGLLSKRIEHTLLSPSESINNITVGGVHKDGAPMFDYGTVNPYSCMHPAIYTPFGGGLKRSIKPDLVYDGGRQLYKDDLHEIRPLVTTLHPGIKVAHPAEGVTTQKYARGTSCATALITRHAYHCYKELSDILYAYNMPDTHIHLLIKALTVHGCSWDELADNIRKYLPQMKNKNEENDILRQWIGYGYPDFDKSLLCNPYRVTVIGYGELEPGKAHVYKLPLPSFLQGKKIKRRLTVTLAWMSPIASENQKYRRERMWFELTENAAIAKKRANINQYTAPRKGTLQHEVFEEEQRFPFQEDDSLSIKVNCADDAGGYEGTVMYAIAVSLEVGHGTRVQLGLFEQNIYEEVRDRLKVPISIPVVNN